MLLHKVLMSGSNKNVYRLQSVIHVAIIHTLQQESAQLLYAQCKRQEGQGEMCCATRWQCFNCMCCHATCNNATAGCIAGK